jgi:hypothetical protein
MTQGTDPRSLVADMHVVFGSGGSKAILLGTGAVLGFHVLDLKKFKTYGCASGGFVPASLMAAQQEPAQFLAHVIERDFDSMLTPRVGWLMRLISVFRKYHYEKTRPVWGVYATDKFQKYVDGAVPVWPEGFWTVAACIHGQVLFTKNGVFKYPATRNGVSDVGKLIAAAPPSTGTAAGATCAIPGLMDALPFAGEYLVDGALAGDGDTPTGVVPRHFKDPRYKIIAIDVGDEEMKQAWWVRLLFNLGCGGYCRIPIEGRRADDSHAHAVIRPIQRDFHSLEFSLERDIKWKAVISGYTHTVEMMAKLGLAPEDTREKALAIMADLNRMVNDKSIEHLSCEVEHYLTEKGLYVATAC